jgi:hypothetical protein
MSCILRSIQVTFTREGVEYAVTCAHEGETPTAGTKERTSTAARMARTGLEAALEALGSGPARDLRGYLVLRLRPQLRKRR